MRIVVVGGNAGGMSAAARLRRLNEDADIVVLERSDEVSVATCGIPYFVGGEITDEAALRLHTPASLRMALNLDVRLNHEVVAVDRQAKEVRCQTPQGEVALTYDALLLSPGVSPRQIPGVTISQALAPSVFTVRSVADGVRLREAAQQLVAASNDAHTYVIGSGAVGLEIAENLHSLGLAVTVVEYAPYVMPRLDQEMAALVRRELHRLGIETMEGFGLTALEAREDGRLELTLTSAAGDAQQRQAHHVVIAAGVQPETQIPGIESLLDATGAIVIDAHGRTRDERIWAIGDAATQEHFLGGPARPVALAGPANRGGRLVADDIIATIAGGKAARPMPAPLGTHIVRVGNLQVAATGANRRDLHGRQFHTFHLHPLNHVGYFPGASQLALTVHVDRDGTLLGAQAIGAQGAARRIDVLATAMRAGMSVEDLMDLDLAYAPPYGAAKDPVQMLGMAAHNVLGGALRQWQAWELPQMVLSHLILDVRGDKEAATDTRVSGALQIPHTQLRERLDEVRDAAQGRPIAVHCRSGVRSYLACRILESAGFECASLSGGMLTLDAFAEGSELESLLEREKEYVSTGAL
ncbi:FAD-dependent oxidoreductase [Schaalia suimastitidis]|uniref:FAD-dependent oxidoreductase n=1 Tax=Schaalia suimastitidis TaxID=121163 RepID=UPI00040CFC2E|nr:FAD-dependent oxidoreductase [Schaalia suimastitidis]